MEHFLFVTRRIDDLKKVNDDVIQWFCLKHKLRKKATSNIKVQQVISSLGLCEVRIYLGDGPFSSDIVIVNLHPSKEIIGLHTITNSPC